MKYGMQCRGVEGYLYQNIKEIESVDKKGKWIRSKVTKSNFTYAKQIWQQVDTGYIPIDWQLDFKSGYKWSSLTWYMNIIYGKKLGVDIKVPWELSRMQHLVMLARAYGLSNPLKKDNYKREFRNQILDFIAMNPPRYGVNWRCTMDVGIRVSNWLMAYDIFRSFGAVFDDEFEQIFARSVYDHGIHIVNNLEYTPNLRSNHYLSDIAGLLFIAYHLPVGDVTNTWLAFAIQELISEMKHEFHEDGTNFEASTSYHRLSTEIMVYSSLLCLNLSEERRNFLKKYNYKMHKVKPVLRSLKEQEYSLDNSNIFPEWYWEKLKGALGFTKNLLKDNNEIPQIGDNDSGRFLKINPVYEKMTVSVAVEKYKNLEGYMNSFLKSYYDENILNHIHLSDIYDILFSENKVIRRDNFESAIVKNLCKNHIFKFAEIDLDNLEREENTIEDVMRKINLSSMKKINYFFRSEKNLRDGLKCYFYDGMGVYIFKSKYLYMTVRCGEVGQNGNGGHCHNDQLSIELRINGKDIIRDPGTYLYTALPDRRNEFRKTKSHFTIIDEEIEQNRWLIGRNGLFSILNDKTRASIIFLSSNGAILKHSGFKNDVYRCVKISENLVEVIDYGLNITKYQNMNCVSNGYGKLLNSGVDIYEESIVGEL
ncbi:heparinase II/III family protein [Anaerosinus sp.]|uniref:heparinase II/III family protein n=1 Tax=Selenobaculum sp. TaxID=3074374 RepID=UPI003AB81534